MRGDRPTLQHRLLHLVQVVNKDDLYIVGPLEHERHPTVVPMQGDGVGTFHTERHSYALLDKVRHIRNTIENVGYFLGQTKLPLDRTFVPGVSGDVAALDAC